MRIIIITSYLPQVSHVFHSCIIKMCIDSYASGDNIFAVRKQPLYIDIIKSSCVYISKLCHSVLHLYELLQWYEITWKQTIPIIAVVN